jgi:hypothetical protein
VRNYGSAPAQLTSSPASLPIRKARMLCLRGLRWF